MNLREFSTVLVSTHRAALMRGTRARSYEAVSGPGVGKSSVIAQYCAIMAKLINKPVGLLTRMLATLQGPDVNGFMMNSAGYALMGIAVGGALSSTLTGLVPVKFDPGPAVTIAGVATTQASIAGNLPASAAIGDVERSEERRVGKEC